MTYIIASTKHRINHDLASITNQIEGLLCDVIHQTAKEISHILP